MIFKILTMKLRSFFVTKPTKKLTWCDSDYSKYVGIDLSDVKLDLNVRSPKGKIIHSFNNE